MSDSAPERADREVPTPTAAEADPPSDAGRTQDRRSRIDAVLARVVQDQLIRLGYGGLTIEGVAAESGVAKTTIYRRWSSKAEMIFEIFSRGLDLPPVPAGESLHDDLTALARRAVALVASPLGIMIIPGLFAELQTDPRFDEFRTAFLGEERGAMAAALDRAARRGEIAAVRDLDAFHALLLGYPYALAHLAGCRDTSRLISLTREQLLRYLRPAQAEPRG